MIAWRQLFILIISCVVQFHSIPILSRDNRTFGPFNRSPFLQINESDIQVIDIGNLPEVLPNISRVTEHDLEIIELPIGTVLYKALQFPSSGVPSQTDVMNIYAARNAWLSNLDGAEQYVRLGYGNLMSFQVIKKLKLFDLANRNNWDIIWSKINQQLVSLLQKKDSANKSMKTQRYLQKEIDQLVFQQTILQLTIGYEITWKDQLELLRYYGDVITNNYSYHPEDEIKKLSCHPEDWFVINQRPTILKSRNTTFGGRKQDLNRVGFTTALDRIMVDTICQFVNVDGYYSVPFPNLFHRNGLMTAEIAIHIPRDSLKILETKCEKDFYPCGSKCYRLDQFQCYPGGLLVNVQ
ncbi:unnamed protein product [Adineta ricciae]|uniref:Uncharacterized protein n=1 Tax=Adineta ricciae TaxID=249248 RepID=A0A815IYY7_ADIRI|nr:unnamed protein product [Adineta ricciae]CAF1505676.1 unnamed protein product [Adineta ricciae]